MKVIILAAGKGSRMGSLTVGTPKPMLKVLGKNLLEHKLAALPKEIDEVVLVVGYLQNKIREYFGEKFDRLKITYVEQKELDGSFGAVLLCKNLFKKNEKFLVLMGDDIYDKQDLINMIVTDKGKIGDNKILVYESDKKIGGKILTDKNLYFTKIEEGINDEHTRSQTKNLINTGAYFLDEKIFNLNPIIVKANEYGLPQTLASEINRNIDFKVKCILANKWINITNPQSLKDAEEIIS